MCFLEPDATRAFTTAMGNTNKSKTVHVTAAWVLMLRRCSMFQVTFASGLVPPSRREQSIEAQLNVNDGCISGEQG